MPLFVWLLLVVSVLTLVTITPLTAAQIMLLIDRYLGGHFFDAQAGGSPMVWIHFFWIFGHPEVLCSCCLPSPSPTKSFRSFRARRSSATRPWWPRRSASHL